MYQRGRHIRCPLQCQNVMNLADLLKTLSFGIELPYRCKYNGAVLISERGFRCRCIQILAKILPKNGVKSPKKGTFGKKVPLYSNLPQGAVIIKTAVVYSEH